MELLLLLLDWRDDVVPTEDAVGEEAGAAEETVGVAYTGTGFRERAEGLISWVVTLVMRFLGIENGGGAGAASAVAVYESAAVAVEFEILGDDD